MDDSDKSASRKKLALHIRDNQSKIEALDDITNYYPDKDLLKSPIENWLSDYKQQKEIITVDARSESEYKNDHIPGAINFPILDDIERDEVGFLYKNFSDKAALFRANEFADAKMDKIKAFAQELKLKNKPVYVYCWRGGMRSTALATFLKDFEFSAIKIIGGYKSFRALVHNLFYENCSSLNFVPLTGLTGCGKTMILENLEGKIPIFDIERSASHASSLFGKIRYNLKNAEEIYTQAAFETSLYKQVINPTSSIKLPYLTEGESKRIKNFNIPNKLYDKLLASPTIKITASMETRVKRITEEYFYGDGADQVFEILSNSDFLKQVIGKQKQQDLLKLIKNKRYEEFSQWFLANYYDKRYGSKFTNIIAEVHTDDLPKAQNEIINILESFK